MIDGTCTAARLRSCSVSTTPSRHDDRTAGQSAPARACATSAHTSRADCCPAPDVRGRTGYYGPAHVERLRLVRELQADGFNLTAIGHLEDDRFGEEGLGLRQMLLQASRRRRPKILDVEEVVERFGGVATAERPARRQARPAPARRRRALRGLEPAAVARRRHAERTRRRAGAGVRPLEQLQRTRSPPHARSSGFSSKACGSRSRPPACRTTSGPTSAPRSSGCALGRRGAPRRVRADHEPGRRGRVRARTRTGPSVSQLRARAAAVDARARAGRPSR